MIDKKAKSILNHAPATWNAVVSDHHDIAETPIALGLHEACSQGEGIIPQDAEGHVSVIVRQQVIIRELDGLFCMHSFSSDSLYNCVTISKSVNPDEPAVCINKSQLNDREESFIVVVDAPGLRRLLDCNMFAIKCTEGMGHIP